MGIPACPRSRMAASKPVRASSFPIVVDSPPGRMSASTCSRSRSVRTSLAGKPNRCTVFRCASKSPCNAKTPIVISFFSFMAYIISQSLPSLQTAPRFSFLLDFLEAAQYTKPCLERVPRWRPIVSFALPEYLESRRHLVEQALERYLPSLSERPQRLHESIRYSVLAPGKRIRPILVIAGAEAVGGTAEQVLPTACALECIHDFRRGRPTNHKIFGEALALLAGDALLALAFQLIAENVASVPPERVLPTLHLVAKASGTWGMVGGQDVTPDTLHYIHSHKTGALLTCSVVAGATLAGGSASQIEALRRYGEHIGLAFQIADDILDIVGDQERIGKPVGSDQKQDKATYPRLFGIEESRQRARHEMKAALQQLQGFDEKADPLRAIAHFIVERDI